MATQQGDSRVLSSGHILGDYRIESVLGQGAFGIKRRWGAVLINACDYKASVAACFCW